MCSYPARFIDEVDATYGAHPVGSQPTTDRYLAPCDYAHRAGAHRTTAEDAALLADVVEGHRRKGALGLDLVDSGDFDLLFSVLGESHCAGHQFWKHHDPSHPWHDAAACAALGGDPLLAVYRATDATLGATSRASTAARRSTFT